MQCNNPSNFNLQSLVHGNYDGLFVLLVPIDHAPHTGIREYTGRQKMLAIACDLDDVEREYITRRAAPFA